jgi:hypothetical protein
MQPIARNELLPLGEYETIRSRFRARVIEEKRVRRVSIGDFLSATFENRDTVLLQIQEMLRTERITSESAIAHELQTYNALIPGPDELSFTLFVEIADRELRDRTLTELAGLETAVYVEVGGTRFPAVQELPAGHRPDRTTAVHYFKAVLAPAAAAALRARTAPVALGVAHPHCTLRTELGAGLVAALAEDLQGQAGG